MSHLIFHCAGVSYDVCILQEETSLINEHTLNQQDSGGSSPKSQKEQNEPQDSAPHNNMLESDDRDSINQIESTVVSSSHQDLD